MCIRDRPIPCLAKVARHGHPRAELDYAAGGRIVITRMSVSLIRARPIAPQDDGPVFSIWSPGFSVSSPSPTIRRKCLPRLIGALRQFQAGTEISGILGFTMLRLLEIKIDYRDGLVDFHYDPKRLIHF